jgi:hypothetical protein
VPGILHTSFPNFTALQVYVAFTVQMKELRSEADLQSHNVKAKLKLSVELLGFKLPLDCIFI